jgi:hypothetical protein
VRWCNPHAGTRKGWSVLPNPLLSPDASRGRLQFFYHYRGSSLPIRDLAQGKKEPHLEKNAENYCVSCYQNRIVAFLRNRDEKYLFLVTRCNNQNMSPYHRKLYIVGYIRKDRALRRHKIKTKNGCRTISRWWAVQGKSFVVSFEQAYLLDDLKRFDSRTNFRHLRNPCLAGHETQQVLKAIHSGVDIRSEWLKEIRKVTSKLR